MHFHSYEGKRRFFRACEIAAITRHLNGVDRFQYICDHETPREVAYITSVVNTVREIKEDLENENIVFVGKLFVSGATGVLRPISSLEMEEAHDPR